MIFKRTLQGLLVAVVLFMAASCAGRAVMRYDKLSKAVGANDFLSIIAQIRGDPNLYGNNSRFLYYMDLGTLFHYAGLYDSSNVYLEHAVKTWDDLYAHSVTNEAASILTNDNVRPYRSKPYELTMLHQLMMVNYMAQGKVDEALVESRRTQLLFDEWDRKDKKDEKFQSDGLFHYLSAIVYDASGARSDALISLYHSVKAYNQGAVALPPQVRDYSYYRLLNGNRPDDIATLKLTVGTPENSVPSLRSDQSEIIVVGYSGKGPILTETSWQGTYIRDGLLVLNHTTTDGQSETVTMPAPPLPQAEYDKAANGQKTESGTTFHVKIATPTLKPIASQTDHFLVTSDQASAPVRSVAMTDIDKLAAQYLDDSRAATITRTVIRVVLRTIIAQQTKKQLQTNDGLVNLFVNIGTDVVSDLLENADIRCCFLLPRTVHLTRIPVAAGVHSVEVAACDRSGAPLQTKRFEGVKVGAGQKVFLVYTSMQ
jgi:hypothetical protein